MEVGIIYLIIINLLSFACLRSDKKRANFSRYKIGTRTFFALSLLGGSLGVLMGMYYYRYLLDRKSLRYGIPGIMVIHLIIVLLLVM